MRIFIRKFIIKGVATFLGVGYLPLFPGTFGSLAGLGIYFLIAKNLLVYLLVTVVLSCLGVICASEAEDLFSQKDSRYIVIDEVVGMLVSLLFLPYSLPTLVLGFFLFRLFDTLKPFPVARLQDLPSGWGVLADDLAAGFYTNITLQILVRCASFTIS